MNRDEIIALYCKENSMDIDIYMKVCDELKAYKTFSYMKEVDGKYEYRCNQRMLRKTSSYKVVDNRKHIYNYNYFETEEKYVDIVTNNVVFKNCQLIGNIGPRVYIVYNDKIKFIKRRDVLRVREDVTMNNIIRLNKIWSLN